MDLDLHRTCANTIKSLSIDAVDAANSGHPGMPLGMADAATVLWASFLKHDPADPSWPDRDRFVLSAGHGSMLIYALLHLAGYDLSLDDLRRFRQLGSRTPGHPEFGHTDGVETTTGPLGQGISTAVGMAIAERFQRETFGPELCDHHTWVIASDGDLMEGISYEACSLAGHLGLGRLNVLYDDNEISIEGSTDLAFTEDRLARFQAQGWHVLSIDGHDPAAVAQALTEAKAQTTRPSLIACRTIIGKDSPLAGSEASHGAPLGAERTRQTKIALGLDPDKAFDVPEAAKRALRSHEGPSQRAAWSARLQDHPRGADFLSWHHDSGEDLAARAPWPSFEPGGSLATRKASAACLKAIASAAPNLIGGSADLAGSNGTNIGKPSFTKERFQGAGTLHFGVREHAMAAIANGLCLHGGVRPYVATFLVFHDYMRPSVRLSCLMKQPVLYIYTHDSVFLGEDGPTHQPIETLLAMRALPNLEVWRPADANETVAATREILQRTDGPSALVLTRQNLPHLSPPDPRDMAKGAIVRRNPADSPDVVLLATGSEVSLCLEAAEVLAGQGVQAKVVSLPCLERFEALDSAERDAILPPGIPRVSVEAGATLGWRHLVGPKGRAFGIDDFGLSAPAEDIAEALGFTPESIAHVARSVLGS
ncbi:MAG: transketolase [Deltaproteobacteria bacterium]|nr:MAG: transketolase [Deltaproteobacteria bacterium]